MLSDLTILSTTNTNYDIRLGNIYKIIKSDTYSDILSMLDQIDIVDIYQITMLMAIFHKNEKIGRQLLPYIQFTNDQPVYTLSKTIIKTAISMNQNYVIDYVLDMGIELTGGQISMIFNGDNIYLIKQLILKTCDCEYFKKILYKIQQSHIDELMPWLMGDNIPNNNFIILINVFQQLMVEYQFLPNYLLFAKYLTGYIDNSIIAYVSFLNNDKKLCMTSLVDGSDIIKFLNMIQNSDYDQYYTEISIVQCDILDKIVADGYALPLPIIYWLVGHSTNSLMDILSLVQKSFDIERHTICISETQVLFYDDITYDKMNLIKEIFYYDPDSCIQFPNNIDILKWFLENNYNFRKINLADNLNKIFIDFIIENNIKVDINTGYQRCIDTYCFDKLYQLLELDTSSDKLDMKLSVSLFNIYFGLVDNTLKLGNSIEYVWEMRSLLNRFTYVPQDYIYTIMRILSKYSVHKNPEYVKFFNMIISRYNNNFLTLCKFIYSHYVYTGEQKLNITNYELELILKIAHINNNSSCLIWLYKLPQINCMTMYRLPTDYKKYIEAMQYSDAINFNIEYNIRKKIFQSLLSTSNFNDDIFKLIDIYYLYNASELADIMITAPLV